MRPGKRSRIIGIFFATLVWGAIGTGRLVSAQSDPSPSTPVSPRAPSPSATITIDFDHYETGPVSKEFVSLLYGRGQEGAWEIRPDPSAVSGKKVLAQTSYEPVDYRFPLLIYNSVVAKNVRVAVYCKPVSGKIDQAAGVIVRFQNAENFYVARANAFEDTIQLYRIVNGERQVVAGVNAHVASGQWHSLEVVAQGDNLTISFDGQPQFNVRDETFASAGKVGLSTKSDGVIIFDDLQITVLDAQNAPLP